MSLKPEEISKLIKDQIRRYDEDLEIDETGTIITVGDGIALIYGLQNAMAGELLRFPGDIYGMVLNLEEEHVGAVLMGDDSNIREGDEVKRTGRIVGFPLGTVCWDVLSMHLDRQLTEENRSKVISSVR